MNQFSLRFQYIDGTVVPITNIGSDGVQIGEETSAWPRNMELTLEPISSGTKAKWKLVRERMGWSKNEVHLDALVTEVGTIVFREVAEDTLPYGVYSLRFGIEDVNATKKIYDLKIEASADPLIVKVRPEARVFSLTCSISKFDSEIKRIIQNTAVLDGKDIEAWFADQTRRPTRKACLLNVLAKVRMLPEDVITQIRSVFLADVDRIYVEANPQLSLEVQKLFKADLGVEKGHYRLLKRVSAKYPTLNLSKPHSYREPVTKFSLQSVITVSSGPIKDPPAFADLDIDWGSPTADLVGLFTHIGELVMPGRTDHIKLGKSLKGKIRDYLYYTIE